LAIIEILKNIFLGVFCHEVLKLTAKWTPQTFLIDVVKAVVERIDHPDIDYSSSLCSYFSLDFLLRILFYYL
jgi:hypothetical protein